MRGWCVALLALALAGCSGSGGGAGAGGSGGSEGTGGDSADGGGLPLPSWAVGDYWTYESSFGEATYVVTADAGADWQMDTTNPESAFLDALEDVSRLGPQRKSDLAGSQGTDRVEFFQWPLAAGATWSTTWDGQPLRIEVTEVADGQAMLQATNATGLVYSYTYDSAVGWFRSLQAYAPDGTVARGFELTASGGNFTGEVVRWSLDVLRDYQGTGPTQTDATPLTVPAGATDLWLSFLLDCPSGGGYTLAFGPAAPEAAAQAYRLSDQCVGSVAVGEAVVAAPVAGTWLYALGFGGGPEPPAASVLLLARTIEAIPFP